MYFVKMYEVRNTELTPEATTFQWLDSRAISRYFHAVSKNELLLQVLNITQFIRILNIHVQGDREIYTQFSNNSKNFIFSYYKILMSINERTEVCVYI